jgi:hypothetical protein
LVFLLILILILLLTVLYWSELEVMWTWDARDLINKLDEPSDMGVCSFCR